METSKAMLQMSVMRVSIAPLEESGPAETLVNLVCKISDAGVIQTLPNLPQLVLR